MPSHLSYYASRELIKPSLRHQHEMSPLHTFCPSSALEGIACVTAEGPSKNLVNIWSRRLRRSSRGRIAFCDPPPFLSLLLRPLVLTSLTRTWSEFANQTSLVNIIFERHVRPRVSFPAPLYDCLRCRVAAKATSAYLTTSWLDRWQPQR